MVLHLFVAFLKIFIIWVKTYDPKLKMSDLLKLLKIATFLEKVKCICNQKFNQFWKMLSEMYIFEFI